MSDARQAIAAILDAFEDGLWNIEQAADHIMAVCGSADAAPSGQAGTPTTWDHLHAVREDLAWRIGLAAKNGDDEACGVLVALTKAIDDALNFGRLLRASSSRAAAVPVCPHIRQGDEGTAYCALAEAGSRAAATPLNHFGLKVCEAYGGDPADPGWQTPEGIAQIIESLSSQARGNWAEGYAASERSSGRAAATGATPDHLEKAIQKLKDAGNDEISNSLRHHLLGRLSAASELVALRADASLEIFAQWLDRKGLFAFAQTTRDYATTLRAAPPGAATPSDKVDRYVVGQLPEVEAKLREQAAALDRAAQVVRDTADFAARSFDYARAPGAATPDDPWSRLAVLTPGWDSYGAPAINPRAIARARQWLESVAMVPTSEGGVQLEWHSEGHDVEMEFHPDGGMSPWVSASRPRAATGEPSEEGK